VYVSQCFFWLRFFWLEFLVGVLLVAEEETMLVVSELLEKREMIPPGSVTLEEGEALLFSGTSLVIW